MLFCVQKLKETCSPVHCLIAREAFIYGSTSDLGFSRGKNKPKASPLAHMKFLPLRWAEGAWQWMPVLHQKQGPSVGRLFQHSLELFDLSTGHHRQCLSQLITQQACRSPVTFPRRTGRKAMTQKRRKGVVCFRREIIECYRDGKHWADNRQIQRFSL